MAAKIEERFQVGMYKARRVIRTESNYCINQSELKGMKDAGFDEYEFISLGEEAEDVCDTCDDLDGQRFKIADAVVGVNCPPMHPFCRCKVTTPQETLEDIQADIDRMLDGRSIDDIERELDRLIEEREALPKSDSKEENSLNMLTGEDNGGIIKSLDIDDYNVLANGRGIDQEVSDVITGTIKDYEKKGGMYISDVHFGSSYDANTGKPALFQIIVSPYGLTELNINSDILSGKSLNEVNELIAKTKSNLPQNLTEAVVHECGHAKAYYGKTVHEVEEMNNAIKDKGVYGISVIAKLDGAECIAETEVLLYRHESVPQDALDLYYQYVKRR